MPVGQFDEKDQEEDNFNILLSVHAAKLKNCDEMYLKQFPYKSIANWAITKRVTGEFTIKLEERKGGQTWAIPETGPE